MVKCRIKPDTCPLLLIQKTSPDILTELNRHAHQTNFLQISFVANIRNPKDKCVVRMEMDKKCDYWWENTVTEVT